MKVYRNEVMVGGKPKVLVTINQHEGIETQVVSKRISKLHHIHVLDRSGSMSYSINNLVDQVQRTFELMGPEDIVSVVWFSGPGQYKTLLKGAKPTPESKKLLDTLRGTLGTTCFSESLKEVGEIITDLSSLCENVSVTVFTDGCAVVPWGETEEANRVYAVLEGIKSKVLAINTVGYGNYYNQGFLQKMATYSEFGTFVHSLEIAGYFDIYKKNFEKISESVVENISVMSPNKVDVVYLTRNLTAMRSGIYNVSRVDPSKNQFFLVMDADCKVTICNNGISTVVDTKTLKEQVRDNTLENFYYGYAYNLYYSGRRQEALDVLVHEARDKVLADSQMAAFTFDEVAEHTQSLEASVFENSRRKAGGECPSNYLPSPDAYCVVDLLYDLSRGGYYVPFHSEAAEYERIGLKTVDEHNCFKKSDVPVYSEFSDMTFNKDKLNISVKFRINGTVTLNPNEARHVGLDPEFESYMFRTHTIIKDGTLNMSKIVVTVPEELRDYLKRKLGRSFKVIDTHNFPVKDVEEDAGTGESYVLAVIYLSRIPVINRSYVELASKTVDVLKNAEDLLKLEAQQKVVNNFLKKVYTYNPVARKQGAFKSYTMDQIRLLESFGIDKTGGYHGVERKTAAKTDADYYEARTMEFQVKGMASLPTFDKFEEAASKNKTLTGGNLVMQNALKEVEKLAADAKLELDVPNVQLRDLLEKKLKDVKKELNHKRGIQAAVKLAKVLTGDWFPGVKDDGKGNFVFDGGDKTLVIKVDREKVYF